ncbi:hypothetical protein [Tenacibaculum amylolyticum]|uniref:hypothetical protein n=1 Tax=Tenacibaculum amylolyticum TaxID=104269 RepID=UPI003894C7D7
MKSKIAMIALLGTSIAISAQNDYLTGQTKLTNPSGRTLLLERNGDDSWLTFHNNGNAWYSMGIDQSNANAFSLNYGGILTSSQLVLALNGNIGIGVPAPEAKLQIIQSNTIGWGDLKNSSILLGTANQGLGFDPNEIVVKGDNMHIGTLSNHKIIFRTGGANNRMVLTSDGSLGIGTSSPSYAKLDVNGHVKFNALTSNHTNIQIGHDTNDRIFADNSTNKTYGGGMFFRITPDPSLNIAHNYIDVMMLDDKGNVGIGELSPVAKLEVGNGDLQVSNMGHFKGWETNTLTGLGLDVGVSEGNGYIMTYDRTLHKYSDVRIVAQGGYNKGITVATNGNVGIGNDAPDEKLAVNGTVHAKEVRVDLTGWPDYVFETSYNLPTLEEVEKHIKNKGHLENIPSAKEVEENGVLLGDMNKKLLEKVEELTLYTIQQEKEIKKLKEENKKLQSLSDRLEKLEKLLEKK